MIGLDIGTYSIKAVELKSKGGSSPELINFKVAERRDGQALADLLKEFFSQAGFSSRAAAVSVSGPAVIVRSVEMPEMSGEELRGAIRFEAEKDIPFSIEDALVDYYITSTDAQAKKIKVLFAAANSSLVKDYMEAAKLAELSIKGIDVDGIALTNAFLGARASLVEKEDNAFVLLNIGRSFSNTVVISGGVPLVIRDIVGEVAAPALERLAKDVNLSIGYAEDKFGKHVEGAFLSGGALRLAGLKESLSELLEMSVETWDPLAQISIGQAVSAQQIADHKHELAVAVGLALRDD